MIQEDNGKNNSSIKKNDFTNPNYDKKEADWLLNKDREERAYIDKKRKEQKQEPEISEEEKEILSDNHLLINIINEVQTVEGIAGEEDSIIALTIVSETRLTLIASAESKNLLLSDQTGIGKDKTTKGTLKVIIPEEEHLHLTKTTPETFTYWHANEPDWTWDGKVIHFEDITNAILNCSTFKVMASGGSKAVVVHNQKTVELTINGKPVMILTSHHANPNDENLRRFPIGSLDNSIKQTKRVKEKISEKYALKKLESPNTALRHALHSLKSYNVKIPYAGLLQFVFPEELIMRTHYERFLSYICSSAVLHQYQREKTEDGIILAEPEDYMIARLVLIYTTSNPKMMPLSKDYRTVIDILREYVSPMSIIEILQDPRFSKSKDWLYKNLPKMVEMGLIRRLERDDEAGAVDRKIMTFQYVKELEGKTIPSWRELEDLVINAIVNEEVEEETVGLRILEWVADNDGSIGIDPSGRFYLVLLSTIIPVHKKVSEVFAVLLKFLLKRDKERYAKYGESTEIDRKSLTLVDKIKQKKKEADVPLDAIQDDDMGDEMIW